MIYLHHYPASLFSEKIRLLLGHYGLSWHSVEIPSIMPRPLLMPLSGGYRRTPVLQIGADVFADTKVIAQGLARHANDQALYAAGFAAHRTADWADSTLFRVTVALNFRPEALAAMMGSFSPQEAAAFAEDRAKLTGDQPIAQLSAEAAMGYLQHALSELECDLADQPYVCGADCSIADFAVYHTLWFLRNNPVNAPLLEPYPHTLAWMQRMDLIGHGQVEESDGTAALDAAKANTPAQAPHDASLDVSWQLGDAVTVTPVDYGCIPVAGMLVGLTADSVSIARDTPETGTVHNHFPTAGFEIQSA